MKTIGKTPRPWTSAAAAFLCAAGTASAQEPTWYGGSGFREEFDDTGAGGRLSFGDFSGDGYLDLVQWTTDGELHLYSRYAEYGWRTTRPNTLHAFASTREGGPRMWAIEGNRLVETDWASSPGWSSPTTNVTVQDFHLLLAQDRLSESWLILIDENGTDLRIRVYPVVSGTTFPTPVEYAIDLDNVDEEGSLDAALIDWNNDGDDELAFTDGTGLRILTGTDMEEEAPLEFGTHDMFIDVLREEEAYPAPLQTWARDLLLVHHRSSPSDPALLSPVNPAHTTEHIFLGPMELTDIRWANVTDGPRKEMILSLGNSRGAIILSQANVSNAAAHIFGIDFENVNVIGLVELNEHPEEEDPPLWPPQTAIADLDSDGDEEVLFADDEGYAWVVAPDYLSSDLRVSLESPLTLPSGTSTIQFFGDFGELPVEVDQIQVEVWYHDEWSGAGAPPPLEHVQTGLFSTSSFSVSFPGEGVIGKGVYQFLFRAVDNQAPTPPSLPPPVYIIAWSPDFQTNQKLDAEEDWAYPWTPSKDGLGTAERPKISPIKTP